MEKNSNSQKKLIASIPLVLVSKEASIKIGKINDPVNPERCILTKDPATKSFKLLEKKSTKEEVRFTGTMMSEQSSKYLMFQFNSDIGKIEVTPGGEWFTFKKEINYPTMSIEEAEEKMKSKSGLLDYIRNKGVLTKPKKEKKKREDASTGRLPFGKLNDEDEDAEDEVRQYLTEKVEEQSEEERPEDMDPELKDVPSDIEEGFIKGTKPKEEDDKSKNNIESQEEDFSSEDDALFGGDEESEVDDEDLDDEGGFSEIDKEEDLTEEQENYIRLNTNKLNPNLIAENTGVNFSQREQEFIGTKRKPDESSIRPSDKKQKTSYPIQEVLDTLFAKNKRMTYDRIFKDLLRFNFSKSELESHLPSLLNRMCDKYSQGTEFYYFKKSEK
jgi:hypothetical protein